MTASTSEQAALIGGIYSNHLALEAALSDISSRNIGSIYCLGGRGAGGPPFRTSFSKATRAFFFSTIDASTSWPARAGVVREGV